MVVCVQCHVLGIFTPGKTRYPLYSRMDGPQGRSARVQKISPPPGFDPLSVQPVASRYKDYTIPARNLAKRYQKLLQFVHW